MNISQELKIGTVIVILFVAILSIFMVSDGYTISIQKIKPSTSEVSPTQEPTATPSLTPTLTSMPTQTSTPTLSPAPTKKITPVATPTATTFTVSDVAKHNNRSDCWIVISGKVYNVTSFIADHPGGSQAIIPYCGADATSAFRDVDNHQSGRAQNDLAGLLIGSIK